jgi:hypothetical protein
MISSSSQRSGRNVGGGNAQPGDHLTPYKVPHANEGDGRVQRAQQTHSDAQPSARADYHLNNRNEETATGCHIFIHSPLGCELRENDYAASVAVLFLDDLIRFVKSS